MEIEISDKEKRMMAIFLLISCLLTITITACICNLSTFLTCYMF